MKQLTVNNTSYTAIKLDLDILLTEDNLAVLLADFHKAKAECTFDGSFSEYCKFCSATAIGLYLREASRIQDRDRQAFVIHKNTNINDEGGLVLYGN